MSTATIHATTVTGRPRTARRRAIARARSVWLPAVLFAVALLAGLLTGYLLNPPA